MLYCANVLQAPIGPEFSPVLNHFTRWAEVPWGLSCKESYVASIPSAFIFLASARKSAQANFLWPGWRRR